MRDGAPTLGRLVESFFRDRLATQGRASPRIVASYRDSLKLFLVFVSERTRRPPSSLSVADLDANVVMAFLNHLETERGCSMPTRNVRRTALRSFFRHVGYEDPAALGVVERALLIPAKRCDQKPVDFLRPDEQDALLDVPNCATAQGRRDRALLLFLARTGARESEAIAVDIRHTRMEMPRQVLLFGKGSKQRVIPLCDSTAAALQQMLEDRGILHPDEPLFTGRKGGRMSRFGVIHLVRRHAATAATKRATLGDAALVASYFCDEHASSGRRADDDPGLAWSCQRPDHPHVHRGRH